MCRWLAYQGPPLRMETLLFQPENALVRQSMQARHAVTPVNGDGFGVAWWGDREMPGLFRDTLPAWNDGNLLSLAQQIEAERFFAHVRASTGTATSRNNCHPFAHGRIAFMHNGQVGNWRQVRREVEASIPDNLYHERVGTTDTEALFLLALAEGLAEEPIAALSRAVGRIVGIMRGDDPDAVFRMTTAYSDGERLIAARWSTDRQSPSLYYASGAGVAMKDGRLALAQILGADIAVDHAKAVDMLQHRQHIEQQRFHLGSRPGGSNRSVNPKRCRLGVTN